MYNFIDVEASGFGAGSYPIEVGVALANGQSHCTLIRPEADWLHWSQEAESLHGISRDILLIKGTSTLKAALLMNEWLSGKTVYSDAWGNDSCWLALLFEEAGVRQRFKLDSVVSLLTSDEMMRWQHKKEQVIRSMQLKRHRASSDAKILQQTLAEMQTACAV